LILSVDPFSDTADPAFYVPRDASDRALSELIECATRPDRPVALLAPPGLGKTLLLHLLAARLPPALRVVYVPNPVLEPAELCAWTLGCLGSPPWSDPIAVLAAYAEHRAACGGALVWLLDDAHGLPEATARWLGYVVARSGGSLRLVVAAIEEERTTKTLDALGQLVRIDALAQCMTPQETARYVSERLTLACVGPELRELCQDAPDAVRETSAGVPREVSAAFSTVIARLCR
jgi:type II secretory pathway predicted ATPase ExeA